MYIYSFSLPCVVTHYSCVLSSKALFLTDFPAHPECPPSPLSSAPKATQPNASPAMAVLAWSQAEQSSRSHISWLALQQYGLLQHLAVSKQVTF